jgi:hypothetical protein
MKFTKNSAGTGKVLATLSSVALLAQVAVAQQATVEKVLLLEGAMRVVQGGTTNLMEKEVSLPHEIKVMTNATFQVKEGKERKLLEGQVLGADGMLTSPNGSVEPVTDHVVIKRGRAILVRDGDSSPVEAEFALGNGSRVTGDAYLVRPNGGRVKLLDGQIFRPEGEAIPALDSVTFSGGKVRVQKDGSQFDVAADRSLMMNDGTKVFGNGKVVMRDGKVRQLNDGEVLEVEGVVRRN